MRRENNQLREYVDKLIRDYKSVQRDMRKLKSDFRDLAKKVHHNEAEIVDSEVKKNNIRKILKGAKVIKQSALNMEIVPKKVKNVKQNNALSQIDTLNEHAKDQEGKENLEPAIPFGISDIDYCTVDFLKKDDWIVAKFATKKSLKHFVGRVLSIKDNIPTVKFVRNVKNLKDSKGLIFTYPQVDDIYEMQLGDVIKSITSTKHFPTGPNNL
ncbi:unnamed protein product, partial [Brenthis ino]